MKNSIPRTILTILITAVLTYILTVSLIYGRADKSTGEITSEALKDDIYKEKLEQVQDKVNDVFLGDVDENLVRDYTIKGYVAGLNDVYSRYYTTDEMTKMNDDMKSDYVGIGVYFTEAEDGNIKIVGFLDGSPAKDAGLQINDEVSQVNGESINSLGLENASNKIRGTEGTTVTLTVKRDGAEDKDYTITRKKIDVKSITYQMLENNIGYIYIQTFDREQVAEEFQSAFLELQKQGAKSLIVDVRNNGGGLLNEATDIVDMFLDPGKKMIHQVDKNDKDVVTVSKTPKTIDMNVVILTNANSASASELFTGAVRDNVDKCTVVGTKTFGKGIVQQIYQFSDGSGLALTVQEYFTTNQYKIHGIGIVPDVKVDDYQYSGELDKDNDTQLKKAIEILNSGDVSKYRNDDRQNVDKYNNTKTGNVVQ